MNRPEALAQKNYRKHRDRIDGMRSLSERFKYIYEVNLWGSDESQSGLGSTLQETEVLRRELPLLLASIKASSLLDLPCGDFRWMNHVNLSGVSYIGGDIVPTLVTRNMRRFARPGRQFLSLDITLDPLPQVDLVLSRDCLVHFSYANIARALGNIRSSGAQWLLTTHFSELESNADISDGDWRPLNFTRSPFGFPAPHKTIVENCQEAGGAFADKSLALWRVSELPISR